MTIKKQFKVTGMHCTSCTLSIDGDLEDIEGVKQSNTSYAKSQTEVEFDPEKVDEAKIVKTITNAGYQSSPIN